MNSRITKARRPVRQRALMITVAAAALVSASSTAEAQLPMFNGAEGFGGTFTGTAPGGGWFSNAKIYHVTTTADTFDGATGKPAFGTLRGAFYDYTNPSSPKQNNSNVVVVFDVGGTFQLVPANGTLDIKTVNNIYIAGQTAPSPVVVYGNTTQITHSNDTMNSNVILRYMTFRRGSATSGNTDSLTFAGGKTDGTLSFATNMIIDHASTSWGTDEDLSVANNNTNVTVQYSIIADSLRSDHAYGSLLRPRIDSSITYHHDLYADNSSRQPRLGTYNAKLLTVDVRNNVMYGWRDRASYAGGSSEPEQEFVDVNYVGNYLVASAGTLSNANKAFSVDKNVDVRAYQAGNFIDSDQQLNPGGVPNGSDIGWSAFQVSTPVTDQTLTQMATPFAMAPVTTQSASNAYNQIINYVGNYWWSRDAIDARIINNVLTNTGPPNGIAAAAPDATELAGVTGAATTTRPANWDTDGDGMPDVWEVKYGLNKNSAADAFTDFDGDGYTNVQEYLDETGAFPAPAPIVFNGATDNRYAQITNWKTNDGGITAGSNWEPTRFDEARINSGTAVVDAAGQHAGTIKIGAQAGSTGTLNITSGWLDVATEVIIGADPAATGVLNMSGGVLSAPTLSKGASGAFSFTGGTLHADALNFALVDNGGTISPGHSVGETHITGDLTLNSGVLDIEIGGTGVGQYDRIVVDGVAHLGGTLRVELLDLGSGLFVPQLGNTFAFMASAGTSGAFSVLDLPSLAPGLAWAITPGNVATFLTVVSTNPVLAGDYNHNGIVDAADYTVWRDSIGQTGSGLAADGDNSGTVDQGDYNVWTMHFGEHSPGSGAASDGAVPEPATIVLAAFGLLALGAHGWMARRHRA